MGNGKGESGETVKLTVTMIVSSNGELPNNKWFDDVLFDTIYRAANRAGGEYELLALHVTDRTGEL